MITSDMLLTAAKPFGLPIVAIDDIEADARSLKRTRRDNPTTQFLWVVKPCGSVLFPIGKGVNPHFVTFCFEASHQAFLIKNDDIFPIETEEAEQLSCKLPFDVTGIRYQETLVRKVTQLLSHACVHSSALAECSLDENSSWKSWQRWFEDLNHPVMAAFMSLCIQRSIELTEAN